MSTPRVAVVGAGVVGLATTCALLDAGAEVRLYERDSPGLAQSKGRTRVFRVAHGEARLVDLASRSEALWRAWETRFGRRLVGEEGLVITGDETVSAWTRAMSDAGARHLVLSIDEATARVPIARPTGSAALFDPAAGPTRARRTVECLTSSCAAALRREEVFEINHAGASCALSTSGGRWECDEVVVAAGLETGRLAAAVGIGVEPRVILDSRFTYQIRDGYRDQSLACWFDRGEGYANGCTSYGQRVGSTGLYAVGIDWGDAEGLTPDVESELHRQAATQYMPEAYPGLDPEPVDEIRCSYALGGLREDGDGFYALRRDGVTALYGNNLFKFAPLLGQVLCETAMKGTPADELKTFVGMPDLDHGNASDQHQGRDTA